MLTMLSALAVLAFDDIPTKAGKAITPAKQDQPQDMDEAERALREAEDAIRRLRERDSNANRVPGTPTPTEIETLMRKEMEEAAKALERAAKAESSRAPSAPEVRTPSAPHREPPYANPSLESMRIRESREVAEAQMLKIVLEERARLAAELGARYSQIDRPLDLPTATAAVAPRYPYDQMPLFTPSSNAYIPAHMMTPSYIGGDMDTEGRLHHMGHIRGQLETQAAARLKGAPDATYDERWADATQHVKRALRR